MALHAIRTITAIAVLASASFAPAGTPSEHLLPRTTKGLLSIPDVDELRTKWNETQLGQLMSDPVMKPFVEDLQRQIKTKFSQTDVRLGVAWEDLEGIYGGEVAMALVQPRGDTHAHAVAIVVDITGREAEAKALLGKVATRLTARGGKRSQVRMAGADVTVFTIPARDEDHPEIVAHYFMYRDRLVATDDASVAGGIASRLDGIMTDDCLANIAGFRAAMDRCTMEAGELQPTVRWFIDPFGYAEVVRAAAGGRRKRGTDLLKVLSNQGFRAVQGLGGHVYFSTVDHELLHRTLVYAPPVKRAAGDTNTARYNLAARMLDFPNRENLVAQDWVPRDLATYVSFNWNMIDAFEHARSLVNELMGAKEDEDLFEDILGSLARDSDGPRVDIRTQLIAHFGQRATVLSDARVPITPDSERLLVAIELTNPESVRETVDRAMQNDPHAELRNFEDHMIWEIIGNRSPVAEDVELQISPGDTFDPFDDPPANGAGQGSEKRKLPNMAVAVVHDHLVVATHVDFIVDMLRKGKSPDRLHSATDYETVQEALRKLGSNEDSFRVFTRTDEAYRTTYELIRQGKMPEAKSLLGKLLNRVLVPDEEGAVREQQIDGSKLPEYQVVRRYLGPGGMFLRSEPDGWFASGCLLNKEIPALALKPAGDIPGSEPADQK